MTSPPAPTNRSDRRGFAGVGVGLLAAYLIGIGAITAGALALRGGGSSSGTSGGGDVTAKVTLTEFKIGGTLSAPAGNLTLDVSNAGSQDHNLTIEGGAATKTLTPKGEEMLKVGGVKPGQVLKVFCSIAGHRESGMEAEFTVGEAGSSGDMGSMDHSDTASGTPTAEQYAKMDADMVASIKAFPAKTEGVGNQILTPTVLPDGTKQFELTAEIAKWEVAPGQVVDAWTFNGIVPAPMFKLDVGDHIKVILHNKLPVAQDVHWHGIEVPFEMDGVAPLTQEPVVPGADFTYEFTVDKPYMGMYHPHMHGQMTVPNGMFGVFQVGDTPIAKGVTIGRESVPADVKLAVDMPMVLNDAGVIGLSLNGKSFPATAPIVMKDGEWGAITYYNEGLQSHPMHLHQFPQLVTAKDGFPLASPFWTDTLMVGPGERYTVMFQADKVGTWAFHCHILNHAERETGMFGMVTAVVVQ